MKIQDLINELEKLKFEHGNVEVKFENSDEYSNHSEYLENFYLESRGDNKDIFILITS